MIESKPSAISFCECGSSVQRVFDDDEQKRTIFECENCGEILETVYWDDEEL